MSAFLPGSLFNFCAQRHHHCHHHRHHHHHHHHGCHWLVFPMNNKVEWSTLRRRHCHRYKSIPEKRQNLHSVFPPHLFLYIYLWRRTGNGAQVGAKVWNGDHSHLAYWDFIGSFVRIVSEAHAYRKFMGTVKPNGIVLIKKLKNWKTKRKKQTKQK